MTANKTTVSKSRGYLVDSDSIDNTYSSFPIELSDYDRYYAERIVMGEAGNMDFEGICLVAQALRDAYVTYDYDNIPETVDGMGYTAPYLEPNDDVCEAVDYIFNKGGAAAEHRVLVFYASDYCSSPWLQRKDRVLSISAGKE